MRMKIKDMEKAIADGTTVAYIPHRYRDEIEGGREVKIVGVRQQRRVYSGARIDFRGHNAADGVRILDRDEEKVVPPKDIVETWASYQSMLAARRRNQGERQASLDAERAACQAFVERIGCGTVVPVHGRSSGRILGWKVEIRPSEMRD